ncbi:ariadne-2 [Sarotherodon galilaeus]
MISVITGSVPPLSSLADERTPAKGRPCDRRRVGFSPAGDLLLRGTNPPTTGHHLLYPGQRPTEPTDASGSP